MSGHGKRERRQHNNNMVEPLLPFFFFLRQTNTERTHTHITMTTQCESEQEIGLDRAELERRDKHMLEGRGEERKRGEEK